MSVENGKLEGMLVYVMLDKAVPCFDAEKGNEFKAGVVVDEDTADAFAEMFPKQAARKVKRSDFEKFYKVAPPEGDEKNLYVITLKKNSKIKDRDTGDKVDLPAKYKPRLLQKQGNTLVDLTNTTLAANGSYGIISFEAGETMYGKIARLKNVLVTELIEFERTGGGSYEAGDEFSDVATAKAAEKKPAGKAKAKPAVDELESDLPF
jgi:hypothetical protein